MDRGNFEAVAQFFRVFKDVMLASNNPEPLKAIGDWAEQAGRTEFATYIRQNEGRFEDIEVEFNRMCIGPSRITVPPYESIWRSTDKTMNNRFTAAVAHSYAEVGLVIAQTFHEPEDIISNELEFLYFVNALALEHKRANHTEIVEALYEVQDRFWTEHLGHWVFNFAQALAKDTKEEFWRLWSEELTEQLRQLYAGMTLSNTMTGMETIVSAPRSLKKEN